MRKFNFPTNFFDENDVRIDTINKPVLVLSLYQSGEYGKLFIRPAYEGRTANGDASIEFYSDHDGEHVLHSLQMSCQFGWTDKEHGAYAHRVGYRDENAMTIDNFDKVGEKFRFLKSISTDFDKIRNTRGNTRSYGEYVSRFAEVLNGIQYVVVLQGNYPYTSGNRYIHVSEIARIVDDAVLNNKIGY